jgi:Tfp pilus assembly protein FimT
MIFSKGFTLIEILLTLALFFLMVGMVLPSSWIFYQNRLFYESTDTLLSSFRKAQMQAMTQKNDSAFGIKFLNGSYVLFQGDSYENRLVNADEIFSWPTNLVITGPEEIIFTKLTGTVHSQVVLFITNNQKKRTMTINTIGGMTFD